jgi:hypothetical protein
VEDRGERWLARAAETLADSTGEDMSLSREDVEALLELARHAAHESGAKLNAPLVCYLVGRASRPGEESVAELAALVRASTGVPAFPLDGTVRDATG